MKRIEKKWLPALVLAFLTAALMGVAIFTVTLPPAEDKTAELTAEIQRWTGQAEQIDGQLQTQKLALEQAEDELEYWERAQKLVEESKGDYDALLTLQDQLPAVVEAAKTQAGLGCLFTFTVPPNYDRRCLTYLQSGNKVNTVIGGLLGGALGTAFGNQTQNMTQEDVGIIHGKVSQLTDEINQAVQAAERSLAALHSDAGLIDFLYQPELNGSSAAGQVRFWELYQSQQQEETTTILHDVALAVKTLECAIPVYGDYLSQSTENSAYLQLLNDNLSRLRLELNRCGAVAESCLSQEELDSLYQRAVNWSQGLGTALQNSEIWLEARTMQSSLLATGSQAGMAVGSHKMLVTYRTNNDRVMYATDPKGDITAFYGFTQDGEPLCFSRGDQYILFDWNKGNGAVLASTYSAEKTELLYQFACFLRDNRNGFGRSQYEQYQKVY